MSKKAAIQESDAEIVVYEAPDGHVRVEVLIGDDTVWLTRRQMADLFDTTPRNVGIHIQNAYGEGELAEGGNCEGFLRSSIRGRPTRPSAHPALQPRHDHLRRLSDQVQARHSVPHLGHEHPPGSLDPERSPEPGQERRSRPVHDPPAVTDV